MCKEARGEMNTVVGFRWLQISDRPFSVVWSGDSNRHVDVMAAEASESVILLFYISKDLGARCFVVYLSIRCLCILWILESDVVVRNEVE